MNTNARSVLIFSAGVVVALGAVLVVEGRHRHTSGDECAEADCVGDAEKPAPEVRHGKVKGKKKSRAARVAKADDDGDSDAFADAEPPKDGAQDAEHDAGHETLAPLDDVPVPPPPKKPVAKTATAEPPASTQPAPQVVVRGTLRSGQLWTDASFATANLDVPVEVKGLKGSAAGDRWWPIVYTAPASDPGKRVAFFGQQHVTPQTIHMNLGQLGLKPSAPLGSVALDIRATALLTDASGKVVQGKAGQAPLDRFSVTLHSLRSFGSQPVTLLLPAGRGAAKKGAWFTVAGKVTEANAAQAVTLARGEDLAKLGSLLRQVPDFAVVPAVQPAGTAVTWMGHGRVVATLAKGSLSPAETAVVASALGATFAFKGPQGAYVADLNAGPEDVNARLKAAGVGETVYVFSPGNAAKPFIQVKAKFLSSSADAVNMVKQSGTVVFSQPVEVLSLPAH